MGLATLTLAPIVAWLESTSASLFAPTLLPSSINSVGKSRCLAALSATRHCEVSWGNGMVSFMRADEIHPPSGYLSVRHTLHPGPPYLHFSSLLLLPAPACCHGGYPKWRIPYEPRKGEVLRKTSPTIFRETIGIWAAKPSEDLT